MKKLDKSKINITSNFQFRTFQPMTSQLKTLGSVLAVVFFSPHVYAAPPIAFGSLACPSGFVCEDSVVSDGMLQRKIIDDSGSAYYHVSINDGVINSGGRITYDSYVNASNGNTLGGISARLDIQQTGEFNLDYSTILNLGWANDGSPAIEFSQTITDDYLGVGMDTTFSYKQTQNTQGGITGFYYDLFQRVTDSSLLNGSNDGGEDIHTFVLRRAAGDFVSSGSATLAGTGGGGGGGGGMGKAILGSVSSSGISSAGTVTLQSTFVPDAAGYGTDGISTGVIGDAQTAPTADTVFGVDDNPTFVDGFGGQVANATESINESIQEYSVSTSTQSTGSVTSIGVASGADAPTSEVYVATGSPMGMGDTGGPGGGTVSWNTGDEIQVLWIGQSCAGCQSVGGMGGGGGQFSFQQYENFTTDAIAASRSYTSSSTLNWLTDPFGVEPSL